MYCNNMFAEDLKVTLNIVRCPVSRAENLIIFKCRISCNVAAPTYWNLHILCKHLRGLL